MDMKTQKPMYLYTGVVSLMGASLDKLQSVRDSLAPKTEHFAIGKSEVSGRDPSRGQILSFTVKYASRGANREDVTKFIEATLRKLYLLTVVYAVVTTGPRKLLMD
jgi:hypothetical protein